MNGKNIVLPILISVVITAIVVGGGMYLWQMSMPDQGLSDALTTEIGETEPEAQPPTTAKVSDSAIVRFNCEQSGGTYSDGECNCPLESEGEGQFKYDSNTGYCMSEFGIPGGDFGETDIKLQELTMLKNQIVRFNCEQSGGEYDDKCDCSSLGDEFSEYENSTGYCLTADGSPGGELGETARKLLELEMLKNE